MYFMINETNEWSFFLKLPLSQPPQHRLWQAFGADGNNVDEVLVQSPNPSSDVSYVIETDRSLTYTASPPSYSLILLFKLSIAGNTLKHLQHPQRSLSYSPNNIARRKDSNDLAIFNDHQPLYLHIGHNPRRLL